VRARGRWWSGSGGVGSAIAASLAAAGVSALCCSTCSAMRPPGAGRAAAHHYPAIQVTTGSEGSGRLDLVVNATPLGMKDRRPAARRHGPHRSRTFVGEVVMKTEMTRLPQCRQAKRLPVQVGTDMLFEMIPAYLEFFGFGTASPMRNCAPWPN
jgi:shikimate dehydrogenase